MGTHVLSTFRKTITLRIPQGKVAKPSLTAFAPWQRVRVGRQRNDAKDERTYTSQMPRQETQPEDQHRGALAQGPWGKAVATRDGPSLLTKPRRKRPPAAAEGLEEATGTAKGPLVPTSNPAAF